jgi:hypothetical protein
MTAKELSALIGRTVESRGGTILRGLRGEIVDAKSSYGITRLLVDIPNGIIEQSGFPIQRRLVRTGWTVLESWTLQEPT